MKGEKKLDELTTEELIELVNTSKRSKFQMITNNINSLILVLVPLTTILIGIFTNLGQYLLHKKELDMRKEDQKAKMLQVYLENYSSEGHNLTTLRFFIKTGDVIIKEWAREEYDTILSEQEKELEREKLEKQLAQATETDIPLLKEQIDELNEEIDKLRIKNNPSIKDGKLEKVVVKDENNIDQTYFVDEPSGRKYKLIEGELIEVK